MTFLNGDWFEPLIQCRCVCRLTAQSEGRSVSHFLFFRSPPLFQRNELMQPLWASSDNTGYAIKTHRSETTTHTSVKSDFFSSHSIAVGKKTHTACLNLPFTRSTRYSWLGVTSRYWTMEFMVGMEEAFITAACFRLLMLASGGEKSED